MLAMNTFGVSTLNTNDGFTGDGMVKTEIGFLGGAHDILVQADGKILVAGASDGDFILARYNPDGTLDSSFGGWWTTDFGYDDRGWSLTLSPSGKILVAGESDGEFALARFNSDGSLDRSFGSDGLAFTHFGGDAYGYDIAIGAGGTLLVAGESAGSAALASFSPEGTLLTTLTGNFFADTFAHGIVVRSDGRILVAGTVGDDFALWRYGPDLRTDTSFGLNGWVTTDLNRGIDYAYDLVLQPDGKILVAGESDRDFAVARYNPNGTLDASFGGGWWTHDFGGYEWVSSLIVQANGKILVGGGGDGDFAIARLNADGSLDTSFGTDGVVITDFGGEDRVSSLALQADGKILAVGQSYGQFALARYNPDGTLDTAPPNAVPRLATPAAVRYVDSGADDTFAVTRGTLSGTDADAGTTLTYGITGGTVTAGVSARTGTYGTLRVNTATGAYSFTPNDGIIEALKTNTSETYSVRVSDGTASATAPFVVNLTGANDRPRGTLGITGTPTPGHTLTARSTLADAEGLGTLSYQWLADGTAIAGATGTTLRLDQGQAGKSIAVRASYTDGRGTAESVTSTAVRVTAEAGVTITARTATVTREDGGSADFAVRLDKAPNRDVTLTFSSSDTTEGTVAPVALTFTAANWNTAQTLRVTGVQDYLNDGTVAYAVTARITTTDAEYADYARRGGVPALQLTNAPDVTRGVLGYADGTDRDVPQIRSGDVGGPRNDRLIGLDGPDRLYGLLLMDDLSGGRGDDRLYGQEDDDRLAGDDGNDQLWGGYDDDTLLGGAGDDRLYGEQGDDRLDGGSGNDTLDGGLGRDTLIGGPGNDTYYLGYDTSDVITDNGLATDVDTVIMPYQLLSYRLPTGIENGSVTAGNAAASLTGNTGNNRLTGNDGPNTLAGGSGNDTLIGGGGNDRLDGGTGTDRADYATATTALRLDLSTGTATGQGTDTLIGIEDLTGGAGADTLIGNAAANTLTGGAGNDTVDGGAGDDVLIGGSGPGDDTYRGGTGTDTLSYRSARAPVIASLATGQASGAEIGTDTLSGIERLLGGAGNDTLIGNTAANTLDGGAGIDTLTGGAGNDTLIGGAGADTLTGGEGNDSFRFVLRTEGTDRLTDFRSGTDKLQVVGPNFGLTAGSTPRFVTTASQVTGTTPVFIYTQSTGALVFDSNGTGTGGTTTIASLGAGTALRVGDLQVVAA